MPTESFFKRPDLFDKCEKYTAARAAIAAGVYPYFHVIESGQDPEVICEGKKMIMVGSNNYLGLTSHPKLKEAAIEATKEFGVGCVGSRFLNGTLSLHIELEERLAKFCRKEAALVFSTGMQTNLGAISALVGKRDVVITDKYDHGSIIDGCRLSYGRMKRFRHNDMHDLERVLKSHTTDEGGALIVVDGVFSMEGDICDLPSIVRLAREHGARVLVDDAHGIGALGPRGAGVADYFDLEDEVDIIVGTFSKSFACVGGFAAASEEVCHYLKHFARSMIFSASLPPANVASVIAALDIIESEPERRERLAEVSEKMRDGLRALGYDTGESTTPIIPVIVGDDLTARALWRNLYDRGIFTTPVMTPAVPENRALIRVSCMATLSDDHVQRVLDAFAAAGKEMGLLGGHA
ncbi:MAG: aminotransferase class I/II-fold pyridoxal phosphate-dependent enzyme [Candidatus Zixiibacteriota bacterium]|jgi:8-amino-7-oxononanoate synthase